MTDTAHAMTLAEHREIEAEAGRPVPADPVQDVINSCPLAFTNRAAEDVRALMQLAYMKGTCDGMREALRKMTLT